MLEHSTFCKLVHYLVIDKHCCFEIFVDDAVVTNKICFARSINLSADETIEFLAIN